MAVNYYVSLRGYNTIVIANQENEMKPRKSRKFLSKQGRRDWALKLKNISKILMWHLIKKNQLNEKYSQLSTDYWSE